MANDIVLNILTNTDQAKRSLEGLQSSFNLLKGAAAGFIAFMGARKIASIVGDAIEAANKQEDAINKLNVALRLTGDFSEAASADMQKFAAELQGVTRIGDETTLEMLALAKSFGISNEQAKDLVTAAADLSAVTGLSLDSAVKNLGKTYGGLTGELGEVVPALKNLTKEQLQSGAAIQFVLDRFGGAAQGEVKTFSGAIQQLKNTFGDLQEELGYIITQNPAVITAINTISEAFRNFGEEIKNGSVAVTDYVTLLVEFTATLASAFLASLSGAAEGVRNFVQNVRSLHSAWLELDIAFTEWLYKNKKEVPSSLAASKQKLAELAQTFREADQSWDSAIETMDRFGTLSESLKIKISNLDKTQKKSTDLSKNFVKGQKSASVAIAEVGAAAAEAKPELDAHRKALEDFIKQARTNFANAGLSAVQVIERGLEETKRKIQDAVKEGVVSVSEGARLMTLATIEANAKLDQLQNDASDAEKETAKTVINITNNFNDIRVTVINVFADVTNRIQSAFQTITGLFSSFTSTFLEGGIFDQINSIFSDIATAPEKFLKSLTDLQSTIDETAKVFNADTFTKIAEMIPQIITNLAEAVGPIVDEIVKQAPRIIEALANAIPKIFDMLIENAPKLANVLAKGVTKIFDALLKKLPDLIKSIPDILQPLIQALPQIARSLAQNIGPIIRELIIAFFDVLSQIGDIADELIINLVEGLPHLIEGFIEGLIKGLPKLMRSAVNSFIEEATTGRMASAIAKAIVGGIVALVKELAQGFGRALSDAWKLVDWAVVEDFFAGIWKGLESFFTDFNWGKIGSDMFEGFFVRIWQVGQAIVDAIKEGIEGFFDFGGGGGGGGGLVAPFTNKPTVTNPFGMATGGLVPPGFPNDDFPARLTSGEMVVPVDMVQRLGRFLDGQGGKSGSGPVVVQLQVGQRQLAEVLLDLNRSGFRVAQ